MKNTISSQKVFMGFFLAFFLVFGVTIIQYYSSEKKQEEAITKVTEKIQGEQDIPLQKAVTKLPLITITDTKKQPRTLFVDIRPREDYKENHIKDSVHIEDFTAADHTEKENIILIHTGAGTEQSDEKLLSLIKSMPEQFSTKVLDGGFPAWEQEGMPTISAANPDNILHITMMRPIEPRDLDTVIRESPIDSDQTFTILDVRTQINYKSDHVAQAINIPLSQLESRRREIPVDKTIYVYGADNVQGFDASILLHQLGRIDTYTINGGFAAWKEFGYPTQNNNFQAP
jgi:rhodanese-related sulfurtransferase